jgi:hypothetical protein
MHNTTELREVRKENYSHRKWERETDERIAQILELKDEDLVQMFTDISTYGIADAVRYHPGLLEKLTEKYGKERTIYLLGLEEARMI